MNKKNNDNIIKEENQHANIETSKIVNTNKILHIQGLRSFAFLLIFFSHCNFLLSDSGKNLLTSGQWGVSIFLILSGYLSAKFEILDKNLNFKNIIHISFQKLKGRLRRVYPLHFITLLLTIPFNFELLFLKQNLKQWIILFLNIFLFQSWFPKGYFSYNSVSWYLSVFIFLSFAGIPICYIYKNKSILKNNSLFIFLFLIFIQFLICFSFKNFSFAHWIVYIFPLFRLIDFILGINLFYILNWLKYNVKHLLTMGLLLA